MSKRLLTGTSLGMVALLFFAVNVLSNVAFKSARLDLTEQQLYTLSDGTRKILANFEEPLTLRFYYSKKLGAGLPGINSYAQRVQELLEEFEREANGQLTLYIIEPESFSEEEDRAVGYGLQGIPIDNSNTLFYFGLAGTSSTDDVEIIPFFQIEREEFLEYDLAKLMYQLAHPQPKVVGLLSSLPMEGGPPSPFAPGGGQPWLLLDQIRQLFTVHTLSKDMSSIPEDIDVLMIVHPKDLSDATLYAIDQFVLHGGRALVCVDPHAESDQGATNPMNPMGGGPKNSDLKKLFDAWGIELVPGKVVGDLPLAKKVNFRKQDRLMVADYPIWIDLPPGYLNQEDIVTTRLSSLTMASAGAIRKKDKSETDLVPLVETDEQAMLFEAFRIQFLPDIESLLKGYAPAHEKFTLAARITGKVSTAFPDGKPKGQEETDSTETTSTQPGDTHHLVESIEPINIIVVADTDFLQDRFWMRVQSFLGQRIGIPTAANGSFVINALDNLTGSNDLISIRNRGSFSRPFTLVRAIQQDAEQQYRQKEQILQERLRSTEQKIQELQSDKNDRTSLIVSPEQQKEVDHFREELLTTRKELRGVQHALQKNIEGLESTVKFLNIGLMPLLIGVGAIALSMYRRRLRKNVTNV